MLRRSLLGGVLASAACQAGTASPPIESELLHVEIDGTPFRLRLEPSDGPTTPEYRALRIGADGAVSVEADARRCLRRGPVLSATDERAGEIALSLCADAATRIEGLALVHGQPYLVSGEANAGISDLQFVATTREAVLDGSSLQPNLRAPARPGVAPDTKWIEMVIVNDHAQFGALGVATETDALALADAVDVLLAGSGLDPEVRLHVVGQVTFAANDPWATTTDSSQLLDAFNTWAQGAPNLPSHDHRTLLSGLDFDGVITGLAFVSAMCTLYSSSILQAQGGLDFMASGWAHQLGHAVGMEHDGVVDPCPTSGYIMQAAGCMACQQPTTYSNCSQAFFDDWLARDHASNPCLDDVPAGAGTGTTGGESGSGTTGSGTTGSATTGSGTTGSGTTGTTSTNGTAGDRGTTDTSGGPGSATGSTTGTGTTVGPGSTSGGPGPGGSGTTTDPGGAPSSGASSETSGTTSDTGGNGAADETSGCGCRAPAGDTAPGWWLIPVALAARRRRSGE